MLKFILCVTLVITAHAADVKPEYPYGPMLGGTVTEIEKVPYLVTLSYFRDQAHCSGILFLKKFVLTAAHCIVAVNWFVNVSVKSNIRNAENKTTYNNEAVKVHESFSVNEHGVPVHDLAILKLNLPDDANDLESATLFDESEDVSAGVDARITGWEKVNHREEFLTTRIVPTLDISLCKKAYESVGGVPVGQICVAYPGADGKDGCLGDSGSPLIIDGRVAGILSWGNGCIEPHYPGLYTKIGHYREWIDETVKKL